MISQRSNKAMLSNVETGARPHISLDKHALKGKKVVIVGDSDGIGRATAAMLVERGAKVFIAVSSPSELTAAFAEIAQTGGEWDGMVVDINLPGEIHRFFDQAEHRLGRIDALVSLQPVEGGFARLDDPGTMQANCLREAVERMRNQRGGQVISIGAAGQGIPASLRREASDAGIRMTLVDPGALFQSEPALKLPDPARSYPARERQELARCIMSSLAQSYVPDVIFFQGQRQSQPL
jgi:hypothetical protein